MNFLLHRRNIKVLASLSLIQTNCSDLVTNGKVL